MSRRKGVIWKPLPGFSAYLISEYGEVKRVAPAKTRSGTGYLLKGSTDARGYIRVKLMRDDGGKSVVAVHVAVAIAFHGPRPSPTHHAAHRDDERNNSHSSNIYWATPMENIHDAIRNRKRDPRGEGNGRAKLDAKQVVALRKRFSKGRVTITDLSREAGVSGAALADALYGSHWADLPFACKKVGQGKRPKLGDRA